MEDNTKEIGTSGNVGELPTVIEEIGVDSELVSTAVNQIAELYVKKISSSTDTMLEVGKYLIREFYGDEHWRAKQKKAVREKSLLQVITDLKSKDKGSPSKSWIYNSINLVVDTEAYRDFLSYGKLSLSCKVLLMPVSDEIIKRGLVEEVVNDKLSVSQLRERISEKTGGKKSSLNKLLKKEKYIADCDIKELLFEYKIQGLSEQELLEVNATIQKEIEEIEAMISNKTTILNKYQDIKNEIEKATVK